MDEPAFEDYHDVFENRVRYAEMDSQGVVFFGEYATYVDETFAAFNEAIGYPYETWPERGWDIHVVNLDIDYHGPASFPDDLVNGMRVSAIGRSSIVFEWVCRRAEDDSLVASGSVTQVAVDAETDEVIAVPDSFRDAVVEFQDVPPDPV